MPNIPLYLLQVLLLPDVLYYIYDILFSLFLRLLPTHRADSHIKTDVPHPCPPPPVPAPGGSVAASQDSLGLPSMGLVLNDLGRQPTDPPQPATPPAMPQHPALAQPDKRSSSDASPPTDTLQSMNVPQLHNEDASAGLQHSQAPAGGSQQFLLPEGPAINSRSPSPQSQDRSHGMFYQASKFSVSGAAFIEKADNSNIHINGSDEFMVKLLQETIIGAEFDSSARDPPPRCHPETRLAILAHCMAFIASCTGNRKIRWMFGAAGVGKSAIMQSVAERGLACVALCASIFFFVNGRSDGSKAIVTLAYQLAVNCEPYRQLIKREITCDPSLFRKSMSVQFHKFIVEPFIHHRQLKSIGRVLIIIDGLDECDKSDIQRELLRLISNLCLTYPLSPIVWMIASRPEHHITSFFAQPSVEAAYEKEEILVDSDEAREDVERFLRTELKTIQERYSLHSRVRWPSEDDFWKLTYASGGLFVFAQTVLTYIGDPDIADPTGQLKDVLHVINTHPLTDVSLENHPMALLHALYARILSKVPARVEQTVRKLLLVLVDGDLHSWPESLFVLCNWLGITSDEAYAALRHLSSVLYFPSHDKAHAEELRSFHKSFLDYISHARSVFFPSGLDDMKRAARQLYDQCALRVLEQAPDGIDVGDLNYGVGGSAAIGTLARGPDTGDNISLTWPVDEQSGWDDNKTKLCIYGLAFHHLLEGVSFRDKLFNNVFAIRLLATRFESFKLLNPQFLFGSVFDEFRDEFMEQGLLQKIPIKVLSISDVVFYVSLRFRRPTTTNTNLLDPWNLLCKHSRCGEWSEGKDHNWETLFESRPETYAYCDFCWQQFRNQLASWQAQFPDHPVPVLFTSAGIGVVKFQFVDLEDGISKWTYLFCHKLDKEERMKLGSPV